MAANVNQADNTSNVTNAESFADQPIPAGHDETGNSTNPPNPTGYASKPLPRTPSTEERATTDMADPTVVPHPNLAVTTNTNTTLRSGRSPAQITSPKQMSSLERRPTGPRLIMHDPIRGDIPHHRMYTTDVGADEDLLGVPNLRGDRNSAVGRVLVSRPRSVVSPTERTMIGDWHPPSGPGSGRGSRLMSPTSEVPPRERTVQEKLQPTIDAATIERDKCRNRAKKQGFFINGAVGLQVIFGALTTGVAAAGPTNVGTVVAVLGGVSTILASYLAKVRGSGEPEFSSIRRRELSSFLREVHAFVVDEGDRPGTEHGERIAMYRERFEMIIKTDGEDSGPGSGNGQYSRRQSVSYPAHVGKGHLGVLPVQSGPGAHVVDEKQQMWKNEKAVGGVV